MALPACVTRASPTRCQVAPRTGRWMVLVIGCLTDDCFLTLSTDCSCLTRLQRRLPACEASPRADLQGMRSLTSLLFCRLLLRWRCSFQKTPPFSFSPLVPLPPLQARKFEPSRLAACAKTNFELGALAWHQATPATEVQGLLCLMACVYNSLADFQRSVAFGSRQACLNRWPQQLFSIQIAQRPSHAGVRSCAASSDLPSACLSSRNCEILAPRPGSSLNVRIFLLTSAFRLTCARSVGFPNSPPSSSPMWEPLNWMSCCVQENTAFLCLFETALARSSQSWPGMAMLGCTCACFPVLGACLPVHGAFFPVLGMAVQTRTRAEPVRNPCKIRENPC